MKTILTLLLAGSLLTPAVAASKTDPAERSREIAKLVQVLSSGATRKEKADACRELARIGDKTAVAALAALLPDPELSHMARYGLETIPDRSVDIALRDALTKTQGRQLAGVIESLAVRRDLKASAALEGLLLSQDADVAQAAARALGTFGTRDAMKSLFAAWGQIPRQNQPAFAEGLLRCAEHLGGKDALVIYDFLRGQQGLPQVQTAAVRGTILASGRRGLTLALEALKSPEPAVFQGGLRGAQELKGSRVTKALAGVVGELPPRWQIKVVQTLGNRGDLAALPKLYELARSGQNPLNLEAIRAIGQIGSPKSVPALVELMAKSDRTTAEAAQSTLAAIQGPEADAAALRLLASTKTPERIQGLELVARRRMTSAIPELLRIAQGNDASTRATATRQLGELGAAAQIPDLLKLLAAAKGESDIEAVQSALESIGERIASKDEFARSLAGALNSSPAPQKAALLRVLGANGGTEALRLMRQAISDPKPEVHAAALRVLANWSTPDAAPDLLKLARDSSVATEKTLALRGYLRLAQQGDVKAPEKIRMCRDAEPLVQSADDKRLLLAALSSSQAPGALPLITPYLDNADTKEEAAMAVVTIAERVLSRKETANAPKLVEPLEKAAQATANEDLQKRIKAALDQAKK